MFRHCLDDNGQVPGIHMNVGIGCCQPGFGHLVYGKSQLQDVEEDLGSKLGWSKKPSAAPAVDHCEVITGSSTSPVWTAGDDHSHLTVVHTSGELLCFWTSRDPTPVPPNISGMSLFADPGMNLVSTWYW
jgi:hypothetical protein